MILIMMSRMSLEERIFALKNYEDTDLDKIKRVDLENGKKMMLHREAVDKEGLLLVSKDWGS